MAAINRLSPAFVAAQRRRRWLRRYWDQARRPVYSLLLVAPLVLLFELGAQALRPAEAPERQLVALRLVESLLGWLGVTGSWLPALLLIAALVIWQVRSRQPWRIRPSVPPAIILECLLLTAPLLVLDATLLQATRDPVAAGLVYALGAGIYEEAVFRGCVVGGLVAALGRGLGLPRRIAYPLSVGLSALIFALAHVHPTGSVPATWSAILFYIGAGVYLAVVFLGRGLGMAIGSHVAYNLLLLSLRRPQI